MTRKQKQNMSPFKNRTPSGRAFAVHRSRTRERIVPLANRKSIPIPPSFRHHHQRVSIVLSLRTHHGFRPTILDIHIPHLIVIRTTIPITMSSIQPTCLIHGQDIQCHPIFHPCKSDCRRRVHSAAEESMEASTVVLLADGVSFLRW